MKPYYKKNGFFDRLERFSHRIDYILEVYGIIYFIPGFGGIALAKYLIREREFELEIAKQDLEEAKENYNREKYWWMRAK